METVHSDETLKFVSQMLMEEEDLENRPCMLYECLALQATAKSFYDALNENPDENGGYTKMVEEQNCTEYSPNNSREKKIRCREDDLTQEQSSNKQLADSVDEIEPLDMYDNVLLISNSSDQIEVKMMSQKNEHQKRGGCGRQGIIEDIVDLGSLLTQCAQAIANFDGRTVDNLLLQIRQYSSPQGDGRERVAHYFANALEARLAGAGNALYTAVNPDLVSAADGLRAYKVCSTACPFLTMSYSLANKTILEKLATGVTRLHIIDFGILYGFQWPSLIQTLSERPGGPPMLRITGIDFPQPGFRPAERVEKTGRRLANYCDKLGVPFEYIAIAQKWETIRVEDVKIQKDELVVVNSLYRLHNVLDETEMLNNPRDGVLNLIKKINPEIFIHGVLSGTYNRPFFLMRFKEAFFHFSSMFDMCDATLPREDKNRLLYEQVYGQDVMNVIACEGTSRIERPETYKQWKVRSTKAGFRQLRLHQEIVKYVRSKVKTDYHKDFSVEEDGNWLLHGWKGRVLYAISCWRPAHN